MSGSRIGVIGAGYWGPNLIRNFVEIPEADLVAVADRDEGRLAHVRLRYPNIELTTPRYEDLFDLGLDGVAICTPPETHHSIASQCLENGLNVLVEKPLTTSSATAASLIALADRVERVLMVGHTFEYNPAVLRLKAMIDAGDVGQIRYIDAVRVGLGLFHPRLNVIWDLAPHDISILMRLLGEVPERVAVVGSACLKPGIVDVAYMTLYFPSGVSAHVRMGWLDPKKTRRITVVGSKRMAVYDDVALNEKIKMYDVRVDEVPHTDTFGEFQFAYHHGDIVSPHVDFQEPVRLECLEFLGAITEHRRAHTDGQDGLVVVRVIEAAQESLRNGGVPVAVGIEQSLNRPGLSAIQGSVAR